MTLEIIKRPKYALQSKLLVVKITSKILFMQYFLSNIYIGFFNNLFSFRIKYNNYVQICPLLITYRSIY